MDKLLLAVFLVFSFELTTWSQTETVPDSIKLSGVIFEKDSLAILPYAGYKFHKLNFTANERGQFSIWARKGDLLKFSHIGFKDTYIHIHDTLNVDNYLIGVFLTRDTLQLSEVVVVPRYQNLSAKMRYMPLIVTPELVYGRQNIKKSAYTALTTSPRKMDAEQNQRSFIREQTRKTVYKTQILPEQMIGLSSEELIPFMIYLSPDKQRRIRKSVDFQVLNQQEIGFLMNLYKQQKAEAEDAQK